MAFDRLDSNCDGYLSLDELMDQLPANDGSSDAERMLEARRMLREADTNGDGRISKDEFMELLMGTSLPDTLNQYDPRIKLGWAQMDEALEEVRRSCLFC
jgi:calcium-dependent protein kinase